MIRYGGRGQANSRLRRQSGVEMKGKLGGERRARQQRESVLTRAAVPTADAAACASSLIALCDAVAGGPLWSPAGLPVGQRAGEWLDWVAHRHGIVPPLPRADRAAAMGLDEETLRTWRRLAQRAAVRTLLALHQLRELAAAFEEAGVDVIALKGAAALVWLHADPGCRTLRDLDLLLRAEQIEAAQRVLEAQGYRPLPTVSSPEEEAVRLKVAHLRPYVKPGRRPVELHATLPGLRVEPGELWQECRPLGGVCGSLFRLSDPHFTVHTAAHFFGDFARGHGRLNGVCDLLRLARLQGGALSGEVCRGLAARWEAEQAAACLAATLAAHWSVPIPDRVLPAEALEAPALLRGGTVAGGASPGRSARDYVMQIRLARELPAGSARLRYLFRLVFPVAERLRFHYGVPDERNLAPYYVRHAAGIARRAWRLLRTPAAEGAE